MQKEVQEIQDIYADMRGLRHDLRGHINNITQYVKKQNNTDVEELNNYIRNMEETVSRLDFGYQTGNPITDIIIHQKKQEADRAGVKFSVDFSYPKELQIDVYDIGVILNNALENAIEAAAWLNRNKYVSLHSYVKGNLFFVEVENSFAREIVMNQEKDVLRNAVWMTGITESNENMLSKIGITVDKGNKLELDEEALKKADISSFKTLFTGHNSFADKVSMKANSISNAAARTSGTYKSNGTYNNALSELVSKKVDEEV